MTKKKVPYMKTKDAEVKLHLRGKRIELTVVLPAEMEKQLTKRLLSPKRQGKRS